MERCHALAIFICGCAGRLSEALEVFNNDSIGAEGIADHHLTGGPCSTGVAVASYSAAIAAWGHNGA
eukprot:CAMPEP_0172480638 /NCGR_PEP_ID=MMETSP1066-20121228/5964_1 /TAXON_ID=671091 /ORGANISM="Coscinodiscus wailesii, Strain CCMP2513" /LENGTH=66 /DNA_ID=CAMNT_0013242163 /DNA_START=212 /DNA_END=412 /DNA_ORIENTATION=-